MRRNLPVTQREYFFPQGSTLMSTTDPKGRIVYSNEAFTAVSGFERNELIGKAHNVVRHPDMPPEAFADLWTTMKAGRAWTALVKNRRRNGDHYWVRANSAPVRRDGRTVGYMSVRTAPQRDAIERAEALYAAMREGRAGSLRMREGIIVRGGWLAWTSALRTLPLRWRIRGATVVAALLPAGVALAAGVSGAPLAALAAALAVGALVSTALLEWQIAAPLTQILDQAQTLASGQSVRELHFDRIDEIGRLQRAVNQAGLNLQALADEVTEQIEGIEQASREIAQGNVELSSRTEEASSNLVQTAASMEEISGTVRATAENARLASETAESAARAAEDGGTVVSAAVACMEEISQSSRRISDIISVIDGIAFQTNILALNASVEAARAGEQGRGFAVVAAEVRNLAQRSAEAAREIKALISGSSQAVGVGSERVREAGRAMTEIVEEVKRVAALSAEITSATQQQSIGVGQVNEAVVHLEHATQQNAALVEESAAAAESLRARVERLVETVALFRLSGRAQDVDPAAGSASRDRSGRAPVSGSSAAADADAEASGVGAAAPDPAGPDAGQAAEDSGGWNGVERRGPGRARNVMRPVFGAGERGYAGQSSAMVKPASTGTEDEWTSF